MVKVILAYVVALKYFPQSFIIQVVELKLYIQDLFNSLQAN